MFAFTALVAFTAEVAVVAVVAVTALPVILPCIGLVTVRPINVPTLVKLELIMLGGIVVPVNAAAGVGVDNTVGYGILFHGLVPSPYLILSVSVSKPGSPRPRTGLTVAQFADVSLLNLICTDMFYPYAIAAAIAIANDLILTPPTIALANDGEAVVRKSCGLLIVTVVPTIPTDKPLLLANVNVPLFVLKSTAAPPAVPVTANFELRVV